MLALAGIMSAALATAPLAQAAKPSLPDSRLTNALRNATKDQPGGVIAGVWLPDGDSWVAAVGKADIEGGQAMVPGLQIPIGSTTKTLTGTLVMQEVQKGTIKLSDPLSKWYPSIPKADEITIAMLLNMSSGIADYVNEQIGEFAQAMSADPHHVFDRDELIAQGAALPRVFDVPGSKFAYSNTNTTLLGRIMEEVTGKTYEQLLQTRIFDPLGMKRTFLDNTGGLQAPHAQTYSTVSEALGGPALGRTTDWGIGWGWAAGGLASTISDMRKWGEAMGTGAGVLNGATQKLRLSDCSPTAHTAAISSAYCLGLVADRDIKTGDVVTLWHNGQVFGAVSYLGYYPRTGAIVAVQSNTDVSNADGKNASIAVKDAIEKAIPRLLGLPR